MNHYSLPISTGLKMTEISENQTEILLKTTPRIELILILLFWIIMMILQVVKKLPIPFWGTTLIFPVVFFWFRYIYRAQEEILQHKIQNYLKP